MVIPAKKSPGVDQPAAEPTKADQSQPVSATKNTSKNDVKEEKNKKQLMHTRYCLYYSDDIVQKGGRIKGELQYQLVSANKERSPRICPKFESDLKNNGFFFNVDVGPRSPIKTKT